MADQRFRITRFRVLLGLVVLGVVALLWILAPGGSRTARPPAQKGKGPRPNVVLISLDTLRPDHLGCYGYGRDTSPNLDRFAEECVLFRNAWTQAPWTLPSHMSLFTSMLPSHNRVEALYQQLAKDIPLLAEVLGDHGYNTAALVNNGGLKGHWGFSRGFGLWREYEVDTPEGSCENVTRETLKWFADKPEEPFFLFLHYFDPHDPYEPPEKYRNAFGSSLSGAEAQKAIWDARYPGNEIDAPKLMAEVIGSYDGEIAWLDDELAKLFKVLPPNTLVVIFSDHGEAFEEHGWTTHGAALYEEETRVLLLIKPPDEAHWPREVAEPVMLLDVAPTILSLCSIEPLPHYEGQDLTPLLEGKGFSDRVILSETKRPLETRVLKMVMHYPWKLVYSLFDGSVELYKLPDEQTELSKQKLEETETLFELIRQWVSEEDYWMIYAKGTGLFEATFKVQDGRTSVFIPIGIVQGRDRIMGSSDGRGMRLAVRPDGSTKALFFELAPRDAHVSFDFKIDGKRQRDKVFVGTGLNPSAIPFEFTQDSLIRSPVIEKAFEPQQDGFYLMHYRSPGPPGRSGVGVELDKRTIEQLKSIGYINE